MAKFIGHLTPGIIFSILGIWSLIVIWTRFLISRKFQESSGISAKKSRYVSVSLFPFPCWSKLPIEGIVMAVLVLIGMIGEYLTSFENGVFDGYKNMQHLTMYFFFGLSGMVEILKFYRVAIPHGSDYATAGLGFCMQAVLFHFHLHERSMVDKQMHILLMIAVIGCIATVVAEALMRTSPLAALVRCHFIILQGTWLLQMAFLLYRPFDGKDWKTDDHDDFMVVTILFCWHNAGIFIFSCVLSLIIGFRVKRASATSVYMNLQSVNKFSNENFTAMDVEQSRRMIEEEGD